MRLVYFGSGAFGLPTLRRLVVVHEVALVVTQPDRPAGRSRCVTATPVGKLADESGLVTLRTEDVNAPESIRRVEAAAPRALVVIAFGQKLGEAVTAGRLAVNLHASLLPKYRGAAPVSWAILKGEAETGLSVIAISQRIDAGDILGQCATPIDPMETAGELEARLAELGPQLMLDTLARHETGRLVRKPQDDRLACRAPKLAKADGTVAFDLPAVAVQRRIHGLTPWPGCTVALEGHPLKLTRAAVADERSVHAQPGRLVGEDLVACGPGTVRVLAVQPPGGRTMTLGAWRRGHPVSEDARMEPL